MLPRFGDLSPRTRLPVASQKTPSIAHLLSSDQTLDAGTRALRRPAARRANHAATSQTRLSSLLAKNIPLNPSGKSALPTRPSHPTRGALRNVTNARWDAVDAEACEDERKMIADGEVVWSWRPGAGAKFRGTSPDEVTVARKPVTGESTK